MAGVLAGGPTVPKCFGIMGMNIYVSLCRQCRGNRIWRQGNLLLVVPKLSENGLTAENPAELGCFP